jgi:hypothetical protein
MSSNPWRLLQPQTSFSDKGLGEGSMKFAAYFIFSVLMMVPHQAYADAEESITPADFFCQPDMLDTPVAFMYTANTSSCSPTSGGPTPKFAVCQQKVNCTIVPSGQRQTILNLYNSTPDGKAHRALSFDHVPYGFTAGKLQEQQALFFPTYETCQSNTPYPPGTKPKCPGPNECKGDYRYSPQEATLEDASTQLPPNPMGAPAGSTTGQAL